LAACYNCHLPSHYDYYHGYRYSNVSINVAEAPAFEFGDLSDKNYQSSASRTAITKTKTVSVENSVENSVANFALSFFESLAKAKVRAF
jgi:Zn-dependent peptidase ImmA (M78 family)